MGSARVSQDCNSFVLVSEVVPKFWRDCCDRYGDAPLIMKDGVRYSYSDIEVRSAACARGLLKRGATKGSKIGLLAGNGPEWLIAWLAVNRIGGLAVLVSTFGSPGELAHAISYADIQILVAANSYLRHDYVARLEEALAGLAHADGKMPLVLAAAPYLRSVWIIGQDAPRWAAGSFEELEAIGRNCDTYTPDFLQAVEDKVSPSDAAIMIYTSGTTAFPKAVVHSQATVVRRTLSTGRQGMSWYSVDPGARIILPAPFFWISGLLTLCGSLMRGSCVILLDDHSPRALFEAVRDYDAEYVSGTAAVLTPALAAGGVDGPEVMSRLRPMGSHQFAFFSRASNGPVARVPLPLGMTETFGPYSGGNEELPSDLKASVGRRLDGWDWKIVDPNTGETLPFNQPGELCVRGIFLMDGMYRQERCDVFDRDGYYHTGDGCTLREDGYLVYGNRLSGMIKTSGANVSPEEVEMVIRSMPDVVDVGVVGVPDPKLEQMVVAGVVRVPGSALDETEVRTRTLAQLSSFKAPKRVFFFEYGDMPRTPSHKIRAPELARMIAERMAAEESLRGLRAEGR